CLITGVADHDHAVLVHDDRLAEAECLDGFGHGGDRVIVVPRIAGIRLNVRELPKLHLHGFCLSEKRSWPRAGSTKLHASRPFQGLYASPKSPETPACPLVRT